MTNEQYKKVFDLLIDFYFDKLEYLWSRNPLPTDDTQKFSSDFFCLFHVVSMGFLQSYCTKEDIIAFANLELKMLEGIYDEKFTEARYKEVLEPFILYYDSLCSKKAKVKIDFFEHLNKPFDKRLNVLTNLLKEVLDKDIQRISNAFGNYLFFPNTYNSSSKEPSPYSEYREEFNEFINSDVALMTVHELLSKLSSLF